MPGEFDSYAVVVLRRPEDAPELPEAEAEALDEARGLANEDPAVRAGQLVAETFTWWMPAGLLALD